MTKIEKPFLNKSSKTTKNASAYFARHETFHPRFGWFKKGFDKVLEDNEVFNKKDAPVVLGVGKNMVRAIRYWCYAFKIIDEVRQKGKTIFIPSENFGKKLFNSTDGWDQYLEDPASLWLLHWNLIKEPNRATAWYYTFNLFNYSEFTSKDLSKNLLKYKEDTFQKSNIVQESLNKDVNCLLRMYVEQNNPKGPLEDTIDSPFVELGLIKEIKQTSDIKYFTFNMDKKANLPDEIIVYSCLDFASSISKEERFIDMHRLLYDEKSPGLVFKINRSVLCEAIENVYRYYKLISISDTAGTIRFYFEDNPEKLAEEMLEKYYTRRKN